MRIAMLSPPWIPVPPSGYGGIEWIVSLLCEELIARGHDVTLFATGDSKTSAELRYVFEVGPVAQMHHALPYSMHVGAAYQHIAEEARAGRPYDVVHDHTAWLSLAFAPLIPTPVVHTLHGAAIEAERDFFHFVRNNADFVAISQYQTRTFTRIQITDVVPNAVDVQSYPFSAEKDDYLLCLGRIARDKAQHLAIDVAQRAGLPLVLAGKIDPGDDRAYFDEMILPHVDGQSVRFEGEVPDDRKRELFSRARAFVFPIQWDEPFGLVMIESMACGTPVIATPFGAVPEVVADGVNGFIATSLDDMVEAVHKIDTISPEVCRAIVEQRFAPSVMTDGYEAVYRRVAGHE
ncbi:MAG TPA: glycosyltransferase family 4 protein [Actinomycetota bacterium]|nr:glycosyltransferase family 4 protein [Actinomycetota bacterium]